MEATIQKLIDHQKLAYLSYVDEAGIQIRKQCWHQEKEKD